MIRILIPIICLVLGLGGGIFAATRMAPPAPVEGEVSDSAENASAGEEAAAPPPAEEPVAGIGLEYVRLNNQFIVPVVREGSVRSLVVLSLSIEVTAGQNTAVFDREPRLRDAFLRVMFAHANSGGFDGSFTTEIAMTPLREGLREAATGILGPVVHDVLIVDIVRQDA